MATMAVEGTTAVVTTPMSINDKGSMQRLVVVPKFMKRSADEPSITGHTGMRVPGSEPISRDVETKPTSRGNTNVAEMRSVAAQKLIVRGAETSRGLAAIQATTLGDTTTMAGKAQGITTLAVAPTTATSTKGGARAINAPSRRVVTLVRHKGETNTEALSPRGRKREAPHRRPILVLPPVGVKRGQSEQLAN